MAGPVGSSSAPAVTLAVLSSRADRVSGGSALVDLTATAGTVVVKLNGVDVSAAFVADPVHAGHRIAVLAPLAEGANTVVAEMGSVSSTLRLTAYPASGPIISGPHQSPFACQTSVFKLPGARMLGEALDSDCAIAPRVDYVYLQQGAIDFVPLPGSPAIGMTLPADIATTTTLRGTTRPFVVRIETRVVNRGIYQSAVLHDPSREVAPTPSTPPAGWNRRLIAIQGMGCAPGWNIQGATLGSFMDGDFDFRLLSPLRLGEGYATFGNTLQHGANNCNVLLAAETAMMSKEQFVKTHGDPEFTVSAGCSGGSYGSLQPADMISGLYDGVLSACTYPDVLTSTINNSDAHLLAHYWQSPGAAIFSDAAKLAVSGMKDASSLSAALSQSGRADPIQNRADLPGYVSGLWSSAVDALRRYLPVSNPHGARPTLYDAARNVYGIDPSTGFALRAFDNTGVAYGLAAVNAGSITPEQFVGLNERIGGYDQDANFVAQRSSGDVGAIRRAYQSGLLLNGGGGIAAMPVFDVSGIYQEEDNWHFQWYHFALRERLRKANGDSANFVMWRGDPVPAAAAWDTFIEWVQAYRADGGSGTARDKVLRHRPATAVDGCWHAAPSTPAAPEFTAETQTLGHTGDSACNRALPSWTSPRLVAGATLAADTLRCKRKPLRMADFAVTFTAAQWARLTAVFSDGVCDWSVPGEGIAAFVPDASVGPSPVNQIFDILQ